VSAQWSRTLEVAGLWSNVDQAKLEALEAAWKCGGRIALDGLAEKDSVFFVQLAVLLFPHAVIEKLEDLKRRAH
jgi:hypothetical protein